MSSIPGIIDESAPTLTELSEQPEELQSQEAPKDETVQAPESSAAEAPTTPEPATQSSVFRFLNKDWESQAKAEEVLGSQEGRIAKLNESYAEAQARINEYWEYVQEVSKENEQLRQQHAKPQPEVKEEKVADDSQEWMNNLKTGMEIARSRGVDPMMFAAHAINERLSKQFESKLEERLSAALAPVQQMEEAKIQATAEQSLFKWAQDTGRYPELARESLDVDFVKDMYQVFGSLASQNPQFAHSGPGIDYAYKLVKEIRGSNGPATPNAPQAPAATEANRDRDEKGRFVSSNGAARAASELNGTPPRLEEQVSDPIQDRLNELQNHKPIVRGSTNLGFYE